MGKTVESYRMALEDEIATWNGFARALRIDDKEVFDSMMDTCRNHASAGGNATRPLVFESMMMSIALGQQKELLKLRKQIEMLKGKLESKTPTSQQDSAEF
jgi:hypothetical protein